MFRNGSPGARVSTENRTQKYLSRGEEEGEMGHPGMSASEASRVHNWVEIRKLQRVLVIGYGVGTGS